jgi:uncharacterized protein (TIGR02453 family)
MTAIQPSTYEFLRELAANNDKVWFTEHKAKYVEAHSNMVEFMSALMQEMKKVDNIEEMSPKKALFRIYRDVRFSKDKSPYKTHFSGRMQRATKWLRGGYYVHIEPGHSFIAGGFFSPNSSDLALIREAIAENATPLRSILAEEEFKNIWGTFNGEAVKTAPRGYDVNHPNIDLIRFKQYHLSHSFTDEEVLHPDFIYSIVQCFLHIRPFFNYMSEILTQEAS